jgi:hypothetical protein
LSTPIHSKLDEIGTKYIQYPDIGVDVTLVKERVYALSSYAPKGDSTAILKRYLKARLSGF